MNKWHLRFLRLAYLGLISILPIYALADYGASSGSGLLIRAFDATHGGSALCAAANTQCQAVGLVNSAGAEIGVSGAPVRVDPTGTTTQPVSQATGTNLHAVIDTGSTTAVTQATGTNLHAVIDTGSTTAATQATASNLNAQVVGPGATGAALVGNPVRVALSDGTNTQNWLTALALNPTTGVNGNNTGAVVNYLYNGTAYVAAPGTLNGAYGIIRDAAGNARGANVNASNQLSTSVDASVLPTGAATSANQTTELASLSTIATNTGAAVPAGTAHIGTVGTAPYADGAVPITATATGTTAATTATLAASGSGLKTYICGFSIRANATAAVTNNATLTGVVTATMNFTQWTAPNASGLGVTEMIFSPCIPSSATNTAINVVSGAPGTGGVVSVSAWGYQL